MARRLVSELTPLGKDPEQEERRRTAAATLRKLDEAAEEDEYLAEQAGDGNSDDRAKEKRRLRKEEIVLNQYEQAIAADVVAPRDIPVSFAGKSSAHSAIRPLAVDRTQILVDWMASLMS